MSERFERDDGVFWWRPWGTVMLTGDLMSFFSLLVYPLL